MVRPKDLEFDGQRPTLLYAYGGFENSSTPGYTFPIGNSPNMTSWLEAGGTLVVANIRGGGEFGPKWHQAALKEKRQVELFFKWIKQNLKIKAFLGTTENAVMTQIMAALCVYLLLAYLKFKSKIDKSLQQIIRLLQLNLFTRRSLFELLQPPDQGGLPPPQLKFGLVRN